MRDYCRTRATSTRCQLRSGDYLFWLLNIDEQDQIASQVRVQMARKASALEHRASTVGDIKKQLNSRDPNVIRNVTAVIKKLRGTSEYWADHLRTVKAMRD